MLHCYVDTDAEMKDVYNVDFIEQILSNIVVDIQKVSSIFDANTPMQFRNNKKKSLIHSWFIRNEWTGKMKHFCSKKIGRSKNRYLKQMWRYFYDSNINYTLFDFWTFLVGCSITPSVTWFCPWKICLLHCHGSAYKVLWKVTYWPTNDGCVGMRTMVL